VRPGFALLIYLVAVLLGGAFGAPWLYRGVQAAAEAVPVLQPLAEHPFSRYLNRSLLLAALLGLWPLLRAAGMRSWQGVGLSQPAREWRRLATGVLIGSLLVAGLFLLELAGRVRAIDANRTMGELGVRLLKAAQTAVFVGAIEELLFRGALFGVLRRSWSWPMALVLSSVVYALVHLLGRPPEPTTVAWCSGWVALWAMPPGAATLLTPAFLNLTLAGMILGVCYQRTGSLLLPIGLHAGWIFGLKLGGFMTRAAADTPSAFWGSSRIINGWLAFLVLGFLLALCLRFPWPGPRTDGTPWEQNLQPG